MLVYNTLKHPSLELLLCGMIKVRMIHVLHCACHATSKIPNLYVLLL